VVCNRIHAEGYAIFGWTFEPPTGVGGTKRVPEWTEELFVFASSALVVVVCALKSHHFEKEQTLGKSPTFLDSIGLDSALTVIVRAIERRSPPALFATLGRCSS
jgi:hypothetical protein